MKKYLLLLLILLKFNAEAEPRPSLYIKIQLEYQNGKKETLAFQRTVDFVNLDSLHYSDYLESKIQNWVGAGDTITLYKQWVEFDCEDLWSTEKSMMNVIGLSHPQKIYVARIKSYKLIEVRERGPGIFIYNPLTYEDQSWMKNKPLEMLKSGAELCEFAVYIFENTAETQKFVDELKAINSGSKEYSEKVEEVYQLLNSIGKKRIVVVAYCSC